MAASEENIMKVVFIFLNLGASISIIALIARIYSWTGEDPLETFDKNTPITPPENFEENPELNPPSKIKDIVSNCECGEKIINNKCTEEQIISGCKDISLNSHKNLLRHLSTDCNDLNEQIEKNNYEMHKAFDLGFKQIHKMALGILIIYCISLGTFILMLISIISVAFCEDCAKCLLVSLLPIIILVTLFSGIVNLVLFIIMMVNYYKGYTTGDFLDYYKDCLDDDDKTILEPINKKLKKLNSHFIAFVILNFVEMALNLISYILNKIKKE